MKEELRLMRQEELKTCIANPKGFAVGVEILATGCCFKAGRKGKEEEEESKEGNNRKESIEAFKASHLHIQAPYFLHVLVVV